MEAARPTANKNLSYRQLLSENYIENKTNQFAENYKFSISVWTVFLTWKQMLFT